jgi:hypothetical protein
LLENVQVDAKRLTTFSQTTGEVTSIMPARWLNRRRKITIAAGLAVVVMGAFIFFKSDQSGPPAMLTPPPPVAIPTVVTPLPSPEAAPAPVPEPSLPVQPSTAKPATKTQVHRAAFPVGKRKTDKERPKHRIFQEL